MCIAVAAIVFSNSCQGRSEQAQEQTMVAASINGTVMFREWKQGSIRIVAFDNPDPRFARELAAVEIKSPGPYSLPLKVPMGSVIYIHAYNDSANDGPPIENGDATFLYVNKMVNAPIVVDNPLIEEINLVPIDEYLFF